MKYPDILEACLERLRSGALVDDVVAEYPRFADELRRDLAAAASARSVPAGLPPAGEGARARFQVELQSRRGAAAARLSKPGGGWLRWSAAMPAIAASAAVLLLAVVLLGGVFSSSQTAEAAVEGVVVDNDGTTLTLQTETGLQTISLADQATVSSDSGSALQLSSIEPGQLVLIRGARATKAAVVARRIQLRAAADVRTWCDRFPGQCAELEKALTQRADGCDQNVVLCQRIRTRLQELRSDIASRTQLSDLRSRCEQGTAAACSELQQRCASDRPVCAAIREFLRKRQ